MSPLTKVFVVVLVVLSLLQTAAMVTFVYTIDNYRVTSEAQAVTISQLEAGRATDAQRSEAALQAKVSEIQALQSSITQLQSQLTQRATEITNLNSALAAARLENTQLQAQLTAEKAKADALVASNDRLFQQVMEFRTLADNRIRQVAELSQSNSDLTNKLAVTERERRFLAEQLAEAQSKIEKAEVLFRQYNIPSDAQVARVAPPDIRGVVRARRDIAGVPYATISIGSRADVTKGMEFSIVDRDSGAFLGTLTIEAVEPNEAIGRLSGDRIGEIRPGNEVRTQL